MFLHLKRQVSLWNSPDIRFPLNDLLLASHLIPVPLIAAAAVTTATTITITTTTAAAVATTTASTSSDASSGRIVSCSKSTRIVVAMEPYYGVVEEGNKFSGDLSDTWEFRIHGLDEIVGFIRSRFVAELIWDRDHFLLDGETKTVYARSNVSEGEDEVADLQRAFVRLAGINKDNMGGCFDKWYSKPKAKRDYSSIFSTDEKWLLLNMPSPARGIFGIVTAGVHLNVYTVKVNEKTGREEVDRVWVSKRATGPKFSYPGLLDQIVAGGVEPYDLYGNRLAPFMTLKREAQEEAGIRLNIYTKDMMQIRGGKEHTIGSVSEARPISFYDKKRNSCGRGEGGHLEPGVRFIYDLKIRDAGFIPKRREAGVEKFQTYSTHEVKRKLRDKEWKPNCGLVMLDFLMRKNLITPEEDERFGDVEKGLRRRLPFRYMEQGMPSMASWDTVLSNP